MSKQIVKCTILSKVSALGLFYHGMVQTRSLSKDMWLR